MGALQKPEKNSFALLADQFSNSFTCCALLVPSATFPDKAPPRLTVQATRSAHFVSQFITATLRFMQQRVLLRRDKFTFELQIKRWIRDLLRAARVYPIFDASCDYRHRFLRVEFPMPIFDAQIPTSRTQVSRFCDYLFYGQFESAISFVLRSQDATLFRKQAVIF